jgi:hypothetical protein
MRLLVLFAAMAAAPMVASAQQWTSVGKTREGTEIFVKPSTMKRGGDTVTVDILARYAAANYIPSGKDTIRAVTTHAVFDCAKEKVKVLESATYSNFDKAKVVNRRKPQTPGYQAVFGGSMPQVHAFVCPKKK